MGLIIKDGGLLLHSTPSGATGLATDPKCCCNNFAPGCARCNLADEPLLDTQGISVLPFGNWYFNGLLSEGADILALADQYFNDLGLGYNPIRGYIKSWVVATPLRVHLPIQFGNPGGIMTWVCHTDSFMNMTCPQGWDDNEDEQQPS